MSTRANQKMDLLKAALKLEFPTFVQVDGVVSGDPVLTLSADVTPATQEEVVYIKIVAKSYSGFPTPSLANTDDGRASLLQVATEAETGLGTQTCWSAINYSKLLARLAQLNIEMQLFLATAGGIPVDADIAAGKYIGEIRSDVRHPNNGD